jgi:hypothetical protein
LERRAVVAVLLRLILRWCANFHRTAVHRTATDTTLKPKGKDAYAVRAILPRPERRGLSRTGSRFWRITALPVMTQNQQTICVKLFAQTLLTAQLNFQCSTHNPQHPSPLSPYWRSRLFAWWIKLGLGDSGKKNAEIDAELVTCLKAGPPPV